MHEFTNKFTVVYKHLFQIHCTHDKSDKENIFVRETDSNKEDITIDNI